MAEKKEFVKKSPEEIEKFSTQELIEYKQALHDHETEALKADFNRQIEEATKNSASSVEVEAMKAQQEVMIKQLDQIGLAYKALSEKPGVIESKKTEFLQFIEKGADQSRQNVSGGSSVEKKAGMTSTIIKAPALMTTANVVPNVANGFNQLFGNYIDSEIYAAPKADKSILELFDITTQPGTESIWYVERVNEEGNAAFITEGTAKPLIDAEYQEKKADMKEVAVFWKMTERMAMHAPTVVRNMREHAQGLVDEVIGSQVLIGTGTSPALTGLESLAGAFVAPTALTGYYASANIYDVIMAMATTIRLAKFKGQITAILNPVWAAQMAGIKDVDGRYIVPPFVTPDGKNVGDVKIVFDVQMPADDIAVGVMKNFKGVIAENAKYEEGWVNDDFQKNLKSYRIAAFMEMYLPSNLQPSIIWDSIANVLSDIEVVPTP